MSQLGRIHRLDVWFRFAWYLLTQSIVALRRRKLPVPAAELLPALSAFFRDSFRGSFRDAAPETPPDVPRHRAAARPRLLFLSHSLHPEGAPISLFSIVSGIDRARYDPITLSTEDGLLRARYADAGLDLFVCRPLRYVDDVASYDKAIDAMTSWARHAGIDLIFCNTLNPFWGISLARRLGVPSIWCIRESVDWREYFQQFHGPLAEAGPVCLSLADRLIFVSEATRQLFSEFEGPGRIRTIRNGVDVGAIDDFKRARPTAALRAELGISPEDRVVSVIGTTCERKGQLDFLKTVAKLRVDYPRVRAYVVGTRRGDYLRGLEDFAAERDLTCVTFVPETEQVLQYFRVTDILVCSSYEESFPRVILEAMAFGLPIVSTDVYGIPEAISDGQNGLLVKPGDVDGLAAAVGRFLGDPGFAARLGDTAYATVAARFTRRQMVADYEALFAECLR